MAKNLNQSAVVKLNFIELDNIHKFRESHRENNFELIVSHDTGIGQTTLIQVTGKANTAVDVTDYGRW